MFLRCPWFPTLLIWQQLWLLVLAFPLPERYWVPLTTKPELSPEPRSFPPLPALPDNPTPGLQPEYDDLASSAPSQELAPGLPQVQPEAQTRNSKPAKVQSSLPQEEVKDQLSQPPEEAEPSITQQDAHAQYELGTENTGQRLMQGANVPSGNRNETQHSNMAFVTVRPVDVKVTKSTEAGKKPQPTSSQLQTLTQPTESPEEEEPSSTQQQILAQTLELSEETETPSTYQEAPAQPLGPLGESELSATKTKPAQLSESSRTEEPSEIQLKAPDQPSDWETEELETSPTQLKQPAQFSEHGKERLPTPHHHKAKHPHLTHVTGKPLNLQLAITPEPTTEEGNFPVLPEAAAQPSTPVNDVEPSISQQEAPNLFSEPSQGAELLQFHREAPATSSELAQQETQAGNPHTFEEGEPSWTTQEAAAQPPELPNELIPEPPELQEKTVSPLGDEQVQPPTLTRGAVTPAELLSSEVEIKISTAQEAPAQSSVSLEQFESLGDNQELTTPQPNPAIKDELSSSDSKVPTPPAELAGEYSPDQPRSLAMSPGSSGVAVSPVQQELAAQSSGLPGKVTLSPLLTGRVTFSAQPSEPPEDTEPFSVPQEEDAAPLSEPPNEMESSQAQKMTPPQRAEEEPSPAPPPAASTPPDPPEEVELSSTLPKTLPQLPSEPPNEGAAHPPPRSETTVPTPAQGQAQQPRGAFHPLNLEATIIPERTTDGEFSTALKNATALPLKHHKVTLPPPDWVQTQHSKLSLLTVRPLHQKLISAPGISAKVRSFPTMPEIPSQPPEPPKVVQTPASHEVKAVTPGLEPAQHPTSPTVTDQPLNPELTTAVLTVETQVSVPLQEAASPPPEPSSQAQKMTPPQRAEEEPSPAPPPAASTPPDPPEEVELSSTLPKTLPQLPSEPPNEGAAHPPPRSETTVPTPAQGQAQQPRGAFHPLNLEATIIPERTTDGEFSTALKNATALPLKHHKVTLPPPDWVQTQHSKLSLLTVRPLHQKLISAPGISAKVRSFPTMPEIPSQPPEPPKVVQTPASHEVKAVTPGLEPAQHPTSPTVTDQPLNPELTTAVLTVETQVSVPLQEAASPPPEQPQVMLTQPEQVQAQHPNPAEVTVQPLDVEFVATQYSVSHSPGKASTVQEKQNATTNTDICELCTCQHETLSCAGLSPKHKLHQVPVLEPNNTFTTFNFQENNILHIGETSWTTYRWAEKLNLSENGLTALHKNSFKGLLSLHYLDLSCNKIQFIEAQTFEALPFLQVLNLRCNLVKQISFGTFRAWHGMQFLHKVILNHNPLSSVEDSYLFKLPALRYLDLGTTYTPLPVVQNIIMMTLTLKTLIIPRPMACCLCQFKSDIEVVCKTVKLHCDSECVTNPKQCLEEAPVGNAEGVFMRALEARKKNTETELVIESGKSSSEQSDVSWSDFMDEELNSNDENDVVGALNYSLPNFSEVNLEGVDPLLPLIQRLFSNIQNEANPQGYMKGNMKNPSDQPVSSSSAYRNELKKQYLLQSWLDAEIQEKIEEIKKKKKTGMLMQSSLSSPKLQIVPDVPEKLASTQAQENSLVEDQHEERRLRTEHRVLKGPKGIRKGLLKERQKQVVREKQSTQPLAENTEDGRSLRSPSTGKLGQNEGVLGPGNLLHTEQKVPVSPTLQDPLLGRSATSALAKAPHGVRNGAEDLTNSIWVLENASMRVKSMKAFKPSLPSKKHYGFHTTASLKAHRILKANPREQLTKEDAHGRPKIVEGPLFSAPRNLPHPPSQGLRSSSGEPRVQDHPFPELYDPSKTSTGSSAVENQTSENTSKQNAFTINSPVSATDSALTLISDDHTNERHWEYTSTSTEPPPPETSVPLLSSPRDGFESQLNQQLHLLVPNKEVRRLISHVTRTLKTDCSEPRMHLACAKLITRTGLLMKLLSEQQEEAVAQAHIKETYKSSGASSNQKVQGEPRDHTQEVLGHTYKNKLIVATSVMAALTLLVFIFCLIEICSHRTASEKAKEGTSSSICGQRRKHSAETDSQEDFSPDSLSDIQQQSMVQELQDDDSSDEDNNTGETSEAPSEAEESTKAAG